MKSVSATLRKSSFPILKQRKKNLVIPKGVIVMNTFKDQDNAEIKELGSKNECELVIVPHNLTNKFQRLGITVNQTVNRGRNNARSSDMTECISNWSIMNFPNFKLFPVIFEQKIENYLIPF